MGKENFKQEHMLSLKGKDYLPVAPRVVMFRAEHPTATIQTETKTIGEDTYVVAAILDGNVLLATAHKRVRADARGPAKDWPVETAETGAIGRALALCGYGTLAGDLDEGEQIADAPVEVEAKPKKKAKPKKEESLLDKVLGEVWACKTLESLNEGKDKWRKIARDDLYKTEREQLISAVHEREAELSA